MNKRKLNDVVKGMKVESWEIREDSRGKLKVYVRFATIEPVTTVKVIG